MTSKQLLAQARHHRKTATQLEALAKKQQKLQAQIDRIGGPVRRGRVKTLPPTNVVSFRARRGKVSERILDLLISKAYSLDDMWAKLEPEKVTPNYLSMCRVLYSLGKRGLVESVAKGVWRRTIKPNAEELHAKAK